MFDLRTTLLRNICVKLFKLGCQDRCFFYEIMIASLFLAVASKLSYRQQPVPIFFVEWNFGFHLVK